MEEKEKLIKRVNEIKDNDRIIQEWMVIENNRMRDEDILNTAIEDGREAGIKEGIKEGINKRNIEIAKNMLDRNMDIDEIVQITGLSKEEIIRIK